MRTEILSVLITVVCPAPRTMPGIQEVITQCVEQMEESHHPMGEITSSHETEINELLPQLCSEILCDYGYSICES